MKTMIRRVVPVFALLVALAACNNGTTPATGTPISTDGLLTSLNVAMPTTPVRLVFIHHSCGANWLADGNGELGIALNDNNYYVCDTYYGWDAATDDSLGDYTDTGNWPDWFNNAKMPYVYATSSHETWSGNDIAQPAGENEIIMFKSCYPLSEVGDGIDDEKAIYNGLLTYFAAHQDKLFVLITPPGESNVSSDTLTRQLCDWLVNRESGWLKDYAHSNVFVYDFYCTLSESGSHHTVTGGDETHVWDSSYDGASPYHDGDNHPNATGNQKATSEFIPLLNAAYNRWK
jgi:hypothetical protein